MAPQRTCELMTLSGSTDGRMIKVVATATAGTTIHTAGTGLDEVWLYACNSSTSAVKLTIEKGGTTSPDDTIEVTIPPEAGQVPVLVGQLMKNSLVIKAFAASANVVMIDGWVKRWA